MGSAKGFHKNNSLAEEAVSMAKCVCGFSSPTRSTIDDPHQY